MPEAATFFSHVQWDFEDVIDVFCALGTLLCHTHSLHFIEKVRKGPGYPQVPSSFLAEMVY